MTTNTHLLYTGGITQPTGSAPPPPPVQEMGLSRNSPWADGRALPPERDAAASVSGMAGWMAALACVCAAAAVSKKRLNRREIDRERLESAHNEQVRRPFSYHPFFSALRWCIVGLE